MSGEECVHAEVGSKLFTNIGGWSAGVRHRSGLMGSLKRRSAGGSTDDGTSGPSRVTLVSATECGAMRRGL